MAVDFRHQRRDVLRSLWFLPAISVLAALLAGYILSQIDVPEEGILQPLVFQGSAEAARELLVVVAGTMITVTGLVFVLTVVALQIASTQYSPRLLRSFLQDPGTQMVLSVFVATFAYSLGGIFTVGQQVDGEEFVPRLAVTGSLMLALLSVGMLVFYIQHITNAIRIDTVMHGVRRATLKAIHDLHTRPVSDARAEQPALAVPDDAHLVAVTRSGYVEEIDLEALRRVAESHGAAIRVRPQVGFHLVAGNALAWVWPMGDVPLDIEVVSEAVNRAFVITVDRRVDHDVGFGVRQLLDIELKAVAPSINDPYTAVQAVQHLSIIMSELAPLETEDIQIMIDGEVRVFVPVPSFELILDTVCSNVRRSAAHRPRVLIALLRLLENIATSETSPARRNAVSHQIDMILDAARQATEQESDLIPVLAMAEDAAFAAQTGKVRLG